MSGMPDKKYLLGRTNEKYSLQNLWAVNLAF
jgi:hypothetical protein